MSSSAPPPKTRKDSTTVVTNLPPASKATPPSIPTPAPAAQGAASSGGPISSKIKNAGKDIPISATGKTPKRQKSSRFHITERVELEKLPNLKGISKNREKLWMIYIGYLYSCIYSCGF